MYKIAVTGIGIVAAIPVATGIAGFGLVKGIKKICEANKLNCQAFSDRWEITTTGKGDSNGKANKLEQGRSDIHQLPETGGQVD